ncbi:MAG: DUF5696 domain-containing protein, partial [Defluviitaleaceae bacterium]|nr:DUF5696 domain-containing protein [Defluviitaleaceae bacterium]
MKRKKIMVSNIISWSLSGICIVLIAAAFLLITRSDRIRAEEAKGGDVGRISPVVSYGFDTGPSGFRTFGETADYKLEADTTTGELAFTVKKTGAVWYSNPPNREEDTKAPIKSRLDSQLIVFFMNTAATTVAVPMPDDTSAQSVKGGALKHREIDNGIEFTYGFPKFGTEIVLQVFINGEGLVARIPAGGVRELWPDNYVVTTITLLPFFGCENGVEDGYTLLPDGSGALMRFDNNRERFNIYSTEIYGPNLGTPKKGNDNSFVYDNNVDKEQAYMPVFGMKKNDDAFLAVITGGDDNVSVDALTSMKFSFYNQVYANFNYRQFEFITRTGLGAATNNGGSTVISDYSPALLAGRDIEVTYLFLDGSDANYVGMARRYNEYLTDKGLINTGSDIAKRPFVLDIWGAVRMNKYIWGINREVVEPLTKYRDVITLVRELKARGVDDIVINYIGALAGGVRGKIPLTMQTEGILGSRRDFLDMCEYLDQEGVTLFLEYDPVNLYKGGSGFSMNTNATRTFFDKLAYRYEFNPVTYEPDPKRRSLLLRPTDIPALTSKFFKSATDFGIENITMNDIGRMLYSDFNKNAAVTRSDVRDIFTGVLAEADGAFDRLMVKSGNA